MINMDIIFEGERFQMSPEASRMFINICFRENSDVD